MDTLERVTETDHGDANRLVRGAGAYSDDRPHTGQLYAAFHRSPHAAAEIGAIDTAEAMAVPGVVAVFTAGDFASLKLGNISRGAAGPAGSGIDQKAPVPFRLPLASGHAVYVGQPVVMVVAENAAAAEMAAELIEIDYRELPAVTDVRAALAPGAPQVTSEAPGNLALTWTLPHPDPAGNAAEIERIFASARHVAEVSLMSQRVAVVPLEPRAVVVEYDAADDRLTMHCSTQGATRFQAAVADILGMPVGKLRVLTGDVGGAFGARSQPYPEQIAMALAARRLRAPIRWTATRSESFLNDPMGRDIAMDAALALDGDGKFLALKVKSASNMGAFIITPGTGMATGTFSCCLPGMYDIPRFSVEVHCAFTHTAPVGAYRGAGRPDANYMLERLVDAASAVSGIDKIALRRRNLIKPGNLPYKTAAGAVYDSGDFPALFETAMAAAGVAGFAGRQARSAASGKLRGLGFSCFSEVAGGLGGEEARISFSDAGILVVDLGNQQTGQNHRRVFRQYTARRLGLSLDQIEIRFGDTDFTVASAGSVGSRSGQSVGNAVELAIQGVIDQGKPLAATLLQAEPADIAFAEGFYEIPGTGRRASLGAVAQRARELGEPLKVLATSMVPATFPCGCHIGEVEIDPETGVVDLLAYTAVDDCGQVLDHTIVEGQIHGGIAQGIGQVLLEEIVYDPESGQLLTGSFMDYGMPRADMLPFYRTDLVSMPTPSNALGVKGVGEAGTTGALAAVMNAIADALDARGAVCPDMPATPHKVWQALQAGRS